MAASMPDPSPAPLTGRVVLVTGGSSGIGRAIAVAAAKAGANVALTYRQNEVGARATQHEIAALGRRGLVMRMDLTDVHSIRAAGRGAHDAFGRIDVWINNAGADILTGPAEDYSTLDKLDLLLRVDLRGTMMASWEAVEIFESQADGGVIINMSWDQVLTGMPGTNPQLFAAVKGGVLAFSKALARTVAPRVRVNVIAPGWIETSFGTGVEEETHRSIAESTPMKRWGTPDDVAGAAIYLASPAASFLTGATILVGGGVVM
jgi:3-oxoacyl-[acyl-carrier protein] reductase